MAKKLIPPSTYVFDKNAGSITFDGNIHHEAFLLITDITSNKILYQFNSAAYGANHFYDRDNEKTILTLNYNTRDDDEIIAADVKNGVLGSQLQVFVDVKAESFTPDKSLLDAVGKLRVSNPGNLIDTDFEYGLQSTKWETIQSVLNIPTVYSSSGDLPVEGVQTVDALTGSKQIKVVTNIPHNLQLGDPISVQGLLEYQAEGFFIVSGVPDATTFFFEIDVEATQTGDISGSYTAIVPAKFYQGSALPLDLAEGARTDSGDPSQVLVTTDETHGFAIGTKIYLRNTVGPKDLVIADPTGTSADGRPVVDTQPFFTITNAFNTGTSTGRGGFRDGPITTYDWVSTYNSYLATNSFDAATNVVTWEGHGLNDRYCLLFNTPKRGDTDGGLVDGNVYYVNVIDVDTFNLSTNYEDPSQNIVSLETITNQYGPCRLGLVYKIEAKDGVYRYTSFHEATVTRGGDYWAERNNIRSKFINDRSSYRNDSYNNFSLDDGDAQLVNDGNSDMFDGGNNTRLESNAGSTGAIRYNTTSLTNGPGSDFQWFAGGYRHPLFTAMITNPGRSRRFRIEVNGNNGADGGGSNRSGYLYNNSDLGNGFRVWTWFDGVYNASDPSIFNVYVAITNPGAWGGGITSTSNSRHSNTDNNFSRFDANGSNLILFKVLNSRNGGSNVSDSNMRRVATNLVQDLVQLNLISTGSGLGITDESRRNSGSDFENAPFGLGGSAGNNIVAFQGNENGGYTNTADAFSSLQRQKDNGRFGTTRVLYSNIITSGSVGNSPDGTQGYFQVDYNDSNLAEFGRASEIFYMPVATLPSDANTFYKVDHGLDEGDELQLVINQNDYDAGQRFAFTDSNGDNVVIPDRQFAATASVINDDVFRVRVTQAPSTDDITSFPDEFTIELRKENALYNTVFINNHKIIGTTNATYDAPGNTGTTQSYQVSKADVGTDFVMNGPGLGSNSVEPALTLYRGETYEFTIGTIDEPFYLCTDPADPVGTAITDGVTNNGNTAGVVSWVVPAAFATNDVFYAGTTSGYQGSITVKDASTVIGGLVNGTEYTLTRITDSRLKLSNLVTASNTATTPSIGAANNSTLSFDVDVETALAIANPATATITGIEFRGDFSGRNEYVAISFEDGDSFLIGQVQGSDSSEWQRETTFAGKDVSSVLKDIGGGLTGFTVTVDPTSQVSFSPFGMSNWWELRFNLSGESGSIVLTSTGSGEQILAVPSVIGSYDGIYTVNQIPQTNAFRMGSDFVIPERIYNFEAADVDAVAYEITLPDHNLRTGEKITYGNKGNEAIVSSDYPFDELFVIAIDKDTIRLAPSELSAKNNLAIDITSPSGIHELVTQNIIKNIQGPGTISGTAGEKLLTGNGTSFLSTFKVFDKIEVPVGGFLQEFTVAQITTNETMEIFEELPGNIASGDYFFSTEMNLRPDGYSLHLSFDGGVNITAGTSPDSKIVRQSRKYFRYQSGKGIQNSFAINFNPPRLVKRVIKANGVYATVETQEVHNLQVGDPIVISDAEVSVGNNVYNGRFQVLSVPTPFSFTYEMAEEPEQIKAGGFPKYVRESWRDSYVRAGMFDDQNGFFYEFDGQYVYAVRRSSTLQLAGDVNVTRGSQVVTGNGCSFTTQITVGSSVVLRGQSYLVVEVSGDNRMVVQPAYRGITAKNVKLTKTVDTRTPQHDWNIDVCDGTGPSGFDLNLTKIQMGYADYSWYGAGKIRYGFKNQDGEVVYVHEYKHNNRLGESYFRSGNLPGRYEIQNGPQASTAPTLFHFGTSVIMDGRFDDDKAYLFTANSRPFAFTNGQSIQFNSNGASTYELVTLKGRRVFVYTIPVAETDAQSVSTGTLIRDNGNVYLPEGTYVTQLQLSGANSKIFTSYPATGTEPGAPAFTDIPSATNIVAGEVNAIDLTQPLPLISIRLAPSVDSSLTGSVGEREIINRMQMALKQAGVTSNQNLEVFLILNALPSRLSYEDVGAPSLSELIEHEAGDTLIGGTVVYSLKASSGSVEIDLKDLIELGNSILGGDGIFPAGPDMLTLAVQPQDTSTIDGSSPFFVSGKISWSESQA